MSWLVEAAAGRVVDDVLWAFGLEAVTKAAPANPLTDTGFDALVRSLMVALQASSGPGRQAGLKAATQHLDASWGQLSPEQRGQVLQQAMSRYSASALSSVTASASVFASHTKGAIARSRTSSNRQYGLGLPEDDPFNLVDPRVIEHARTSHAHYLRTSTGRISGRLSELGRDIIARGIEAGHDNQTIAGALATELRGSEVRQSNAYFLMVASIVVARSRSYGLLQSFQDAGISYYELRAVLDAVTTDVCRFMHGKRYPVGPAIDRYADVASNADPEAVKDIQPFIRRGKADENGERPLFVRTRGQDHVIGVIERSGVGRTDDVGKSRPVASPAMMGRLGCSSPPFHGHCRTTMVPVFGRSRVQVPRGRTARGLPAAAPAAPQIPTRALPPVTPVAPPPPVPLAPIAAPPAKPRRASRPKAPPAPKPATGFQAGVHAHVVTSKVPAADLDAVLDGVGQSVPWLLDFLQTNPLSELRLEPTIKARNANGSYQIRAPLPGTSVLSVQWNRKTDTWGQKLEPEKMWSVSSVGGTRLESVIRTFVHELGHHIHLHDVGLRTADYTAIDQDIKAEFAKRRYGGSFTRYAATLHVEYWAETFAAFVFHPSSLKRRDPAGYALVQRVLKARKISLRAKPRRP